MAAKRQRPKRKPSPAQLKARRKFTVMARAQKKANPRGRHLTRATAKQQRQYEHILESAKSGGRYKGREKSVAAATVRKLAGNPKVSGPVVTAEREGKRWHVVVDGRTSLRTWTSKKRAIAAGRRGYGLTRKKNTTVIKARKIEHLDVAKVHNIFRRKYRNGYVDLVIKGQATKTPAGWKLGKTVFKQGKGIAPATKKGFFIDRATGQVFSRVTRNIEQGFRDSTGFHPIRASADYDLRRTSEGEIKRRFPREKSMKKRKRNSASSKTRTIREKFTGTKSHGTSTLNASDGTPRNLAKLGRLTLIKTERATIKPATGNPGHAVWLCADAKGRLHLCTTDERLVDLPAGSLGEVEKIEYETSKPHLGHKNPTIFFHKMGENGGKRPSLYSDGKGGLKFKGGSYSISAEGIRD